MSGNRADIFTEQPYPTAQVTAFSGGTDLRTDDRAEGWGASPFLNKLTPSDCGRLPETTRKVLVQLLRGPYISRERHSKNWAALIREEDEIRERLGDLFLELVTDIDTGVAFVRNMESDGVELPRVIRSQRLTLIDTALVLFLREQLLNAEGAGRRVFVGRADIVDQLSVYRNIPRIDESGFDAKVRASIEKMKKQSVLLPTTEDDRFEVSPILRLVFDADQVVSVTREVRRLMAAGGAGGGADETGAEKAEGVRVVDGADKAGAERGVSGGEMVGDEDDLEVGLENSLEDAARDLR